MESSSLSPSQEDEILALESIFGGDFTRAPRAWGKGQAEKFQIRLAPNVSHGKTVPEWLVLEFQFTHMYPQRKPLLGVAKSHGLPDAKIRELNSILDKKAASLIGEPMIFTLCQFVQDEFLTSWNKPALSSIPNVETKKNGPSITGAPTPKRASALTAALKDIVISTSPNAAAANPYPSSPLSAGSKGSKDDPAAQDSVLVKGSVYSAFTHWGQLFLAVDPKSQQSVCLRELKWKSTAPPEDFINTIDALSSLRHPYIASYIFARPLGSGVMGVATELVGGDSSIGDLAKQFGGLDEGRCRVYLQQVLQGLNFLHTHGLVHGNLYGYNCLLCQGASVVKLTEFGVSWSKLPIKSNLSDQQPPQDLPWPDPSGALALGLPEHDVWQVGLLLLEMLCGEPITMTPASRGGVPGGKGDGNEREKTPKVPDFVSTDASDFLFHCLQRNHANRPSVEVLLADNFVCEVTEVTSSVGIKRGTLSVPRSALDENFGLMSPASAPSGGVAYIPAKSRYEEDFEVLEELGSGGFGTVWKVRNRLDRRLYAMKCIPIKGREEDKLNLFREVRMLSRISSPYVVRYYQAWTESAGQTASLVEYASSDEDDGSNSLSRENRSALFDGFPEHGASDDEDNSFIIFEDSAPNSYLSTSREKRLMPTFSGDVINHWHDDTDDETDSSSGSHSSGKGEGGGPVEGRTRTGTISSKTLYIQMEYCSNTDLRGLMGGRLLEESDCWRYLRQILEGLADIHRQGIFHRDLKPANIFVDSEKKVKIGDFGLATDRTTGENSLNSSTQRAAVKDADDLTAGVGTPIYCSPEQLKGEKYDEKVDMFSLGIIFYEMLETFTTEMERRTSLDSLRHKQSVPEAFRQKYPNQADIIELLVKHLPSERPSARDLLNSDKIPMIREPGLEGDFIRLLHESDAHMLREATVEALFNPPNFNATNDATFYEGKKFEPAESSKREAATKLIVSILKRFGCVQISVPLFMPVWKHGNTSVEVSQASPPNRSSQSPIATMQAPPLPVSLEDTAPKKEAHFLDRRGAVLKLPSSPAHAFARFIAHHRISALRRYDVQDVYFEPSSLNRHPATHRCLLYDVVYPRPEANSTSMDAFYWGEMLSCMADCLKVIGPTIESFTIHVCSVGLLRAVLKEAGIANDKLPNAISVFEDGLGTNPSKKAFCEVLESQCEVSKAVGHRVLNLLRLRGPLLEVLPKLELTLQAQESDLLPRLEKMKLLAEHVKISGLGSVVMFDWSIDINPSGAFDDLYVVGKAEKIVLAEGGSYNNLIDSFVGPTSRGRVCAVGFYWLIENMTRLYAKSTNLDPLTTWDVLIVADDEFAVSVQQIQTQLRSDDFSVIWGRSHRAAARYVVKIAKEFTRDGKLSLHINGQERQFVAAADLSFFLRKQSKSIEGDSDGRKKYAPLKFVAEKYLPTTKRKVLEQSARAAIEKFVSSTASSNCAVFLVPEMTQSELRHVVSLLQNNESLNSVVAKSLKYKDIVNELRSDLNGAFHSGKILWILFSVADSGAFLVSGCPLPKK